MRHATTDTVGRIISGRAPGVRLNATGQEQCRTLARRLADEPLDAVYTSPLERARETAAAIAEPHGLLPLDELGLMELDYGEWTGCAIEALEQDERWRRFNVLRSTTRIPGGESMLGAQARAVAAVTAIAERHLSERVALVSHADIIRAIVLHVLGAPLDHVHRIEIAPASLTELVIHADFAHLKEIGRRCT